MPSAIWLFGIIKLQKCRWVFWNLVCNTEGTVSSQTVALTYQAIRAGSSVGIATGYGLDGLGTESRWGARFSVPLQVGPGAHTASCTMDTGFFPGVKSGRGVTLTPNPLLVPWWRKSRAISVFPLRACTEPQCLYMGALYIIRQTNLCEKRALT